MKKLLVVLLSIAILAFLSGVQGQVMMSGSYDYPTYNLGYSSSNWNNWNTPYWNDWDDWGYTPIWNYGWSPFWNDWDDWGHFGGHEFGHEGGEHHEGHR